MLLIIGAALFKKVTVFDEFIAGAGEGIQTTLRVLPSLVALMTAISMLQASGLLDMLAQAAAPYMEKIGFPAEVLPLALLRPVSGSGSLAALERLFHQHHPDSFAGLVASVLQSSTETTFYAMAVYYGSVRVKRTRHTLVATTTGDLTGAILASLTVRLLFMR